jgi:hypothetical protein
VGQPLAQAKGGHPASEVPAFCLIVGVADGIRTHDNWNHNFVWVVFRLLTEPFPKLAFPLQIMT